VPVSGIMSILGGLSILLGFHGKAGAWLLLVFLVPVTFTVHNFWAVKDRMMRQIQMTMFLKNISMPGSALFFTQMGASLLVAGRFADPKFGVVSCRSAISL
jgi:putative oxidoreductase